MNTTTDRHHQIMKRQNLSAVVLVGFGLLLSGCQSQMMSDDRMSEAIAGTLGVSPSDITLSNRMTDGPTNTSVVATLSDGKRFACNVNGGGLLAMGMVNPPTCNPAQ